MCHPLPPTPGHLLQDPQLPQPGWAQGCQVSETGGLPGSSCKRVLGDLGCGWWCGHSMAWGKLLLLQELKVILIYYLR